MENISTENQNGTGQSGGDNVPPGGSAGAVTTGAIAPLVSAADSAAKYGGHPSGETAPVTASPLCACGCGHPATGGSKYFNASHRKRVSRDKGAKSGGTSRATAPAGLPSALDTVQAPGAAVGADPDSGNGAGVPWRTEDIAPLVEQIILLAEDAAKGQLVTAAAKLNLPAPAMEHIQKSAKWNARSVTMITEGASELSAMALNKSGIAPEYRPVLSIVAGAGQIAVSHVNLINFIKEEVARQKQTQTS